MALVTVNNDETDDFRSRPRWSVNRKVDVFLRLLRGEKLEQLSGELGVEAHRIAAWRDDFLAGGKEQLRAKSPTTQATGDCVLPSERSVSSRWRTRSGGR